MSKRLQRGGIREKPAKEQRDVRSSREQKYAAKGRPHIAPLLPPSLSLLALAPLALAGAARLQYSYTVVVAASHPG